MIEKLRFKKTIDTKLVTVLEIDNLELVNKINEIIDKVNEIEDLLNAKEEAEKRVKKEC